MIWLSLQQFYVLVFCIVLIFIWFISNLILEFTFELDLVLVLFWILDLVLVCFGFVALHCGGKVASIDRIELELDFSGMVALDWQR